MPNCISERIGLSSDGIGAMNNIGLWIEGSLLLAVLVFFIHQRIDLRREKEKREREKQ